jgi:hypothetical protein
MVSEGPKVTIGIDLATMGDFSAWCSMFVDSVKGILVQACQAFSAIAEAVRRAVLPITQYWSQLSSWPAADDPGEALTLAQLRETAAGDGCAMPHVRFTSEGGFSLN